MPWPGWAFEAFPIPSDSRLTLTTYTAAPGSPSADGLALLARWAATQATSGATPLGAAPDLLASSSTDSRLRKDQA
jgi:hypothetical protein